MSDAEQPSGPPLLPSEAMIEAALRAFFLRAHGAPWHGKSELFQHAMRDAYFAMIAAAPPPPAAAPAEQPQPEHDIARMFAHGNVVRVLRDALPADEFARLERSLSLLAEQPQPEPGEVERLRDELATYKRLHEQRGEALKRPCSKCGHTPLTARTRALAPPPPAAAPTDAQDAARYRWLRDGIVGTLEGFAANEDGTYRPVYWARCKRLTTLPVPDGSPTSDEIDAAIDAALAAAREGR